MNKLTLNLVLLSNITAAFFYLFNKFNLPAFAQVTPDGTTSTTVNADGNNFTINDGNIKEGNLFHSFREFSVPNGGSAVFNNAVGIKNIFSRVTGGSESNINGLISARGTANLFLINPAGILFKENASLDIGGSFYGTTADSILFDDGELNALDADNPPLLTVNAPIGLSFRDSPADIKVEETSISLQPTQTLAFLAGNIDVQGGELISPKGQILFGGLSTGGKITLDGNLSFTIPENINRGNISISSGAFIDVGDDRGGSIYFQGKNITIAESSVFTGILPDFGTLKSPGGTIEFDATESIIITDNSQIDSSSFGVGNAGNIIIKTGDSVIIDNKSALFSTAATSQGQSGNIDITTNIFTLDNESLISTITEGSGNAGDINIEANSISLSNTAFITSFTRELGDAGDIDIQTQSLALNNGSEIDSSTEGKGNAGNIEVNASDSVSISGVAPTEIFIDFIGDSFPGGFSSGLFSNSDAGATGQGGTISVTTGKLSISDGGTLSGRTKSAAPGGNIVVNANTIDLSGGGQILTAAFNEGNAGNITLNVANQINISGSDPTFSSRREQVIDLATQIDSGETVDLQRAIDPVSPESGIFASTLSNSTGGAGNIFIRGATAANGNNLQLPALNLTNQGRIAVDSRGQGNGGNVSIQASSLSLDNNAKILAGTPQGTGGNIDLKLQNNLTLREQSLISAEATNDADGGNIDIIDADFIVAFPNNSDILASAEGGDGGDININTQGLFGIQERPQNPLTNDIDASSEFGLAGNVSIITPDVEVFQGLTELPTSVTDADTVSANVCSADSPTAASNLLVKGKGGVPPQPIEPLNADSLLLGGEYQANDSSNGANSSKNTQIQPIKTAIGDIIPARGVKVTKDGRVILTSYPTSGDRSENNSVNCG